MPVITPRAPGGDDWATAHIAFGPSGRTVLLPVYAPQQEALARVQDEKVPPHAVQLEIPFNPLDPPALVPEPSSETKAAASPTTQGTTYVAKPTSTTASSAPTFLSSSAINLDTSPSATQATTAAPPSASPDSNTPSNAASHDARKPVGIALGALAFLSLLGALTAWYFRSRSRARRRARSRVLWVPDSDSPPPALPFPVAHSSMEKDREGWAAERDGDVGEPKRSPSYVRAATLRAPLSPIRRCPTSPFADPPPQRCASASLCPPTVFPHSPFLPPTQSFSPLPMPEVRVHAAAAAPEDTRQSVQSPHPPGAHAFGSLRVVNPAPGDRSSSGSEASAAGAPSPATVSGEFGTPREAVPGGMPRFLTLRDGGLPWMAQEGGVAMPEPVVTSGPGAHDEQGQDGQRPDGLPGTAGWAASIRANLTVAFAAVASQVRAAPASSTAAAAPDTLTPAPVRHGSGRRSKLRDVEWAAGTDDDERITDQESDLSRSSTLLGDHSSTSKKPAKAFSPTSSSATSPLYDPRAPLSRASSVYSSASPPCARVPAFVCLPSSDEEAGGLLGRGAKLARGMSAESARSSGDEAARCGAASALERIREKQRGGRPRLVVRTSWPGSETTSEEEGEERSPMTDGERRAQRMLMERRKANMGAAQGGLGRGKSQVGGKKSVKRAGSGRGKKVV